MKERRNIVPAHLTRLAMLATLSPQWAERIPYFSLSAREGGEGRGEVGLRRVLILSLSKGELR
jgi:hypothetical protein